MQPLRYDKNGVPRLTRYDLERRTSNFLSKFAAHCLDKPIYTPVATIAHELQARGFAKFIFNVELGQIRGRKIRGSFEQATNIVRIDVSLNVGSPQFNFTLAHEIGHLVMHRRVDLAAFDAPESIIKDHDRHLVLEMGASTQPRALLEWQANKFASSLLLPCETFPSAVRSIQGQLGITRNVGQVYCYHDQVLDKDYRELLHRLGAIYEVSRSVVRIRLQELNLLVEQRSSGRRGGGLRRLSDAF